ncbi:MAG: TonB-dependent receptor [Candidatus Omnitrophica bacterium]|nr:TonB-dependent receptor [Candidatus Omnitrophota bacterium]
MKQRVYIVLSILVLMAFVSVNAFAQEYNLGEVIVSATKTEAYQAEIGSSTTVITAEEIKKRGKVTVVELLRNVPGVSVTQQGELGGFTQLYLRGGAPGHTMIMIDGVEVKYLMEHDGGFFDFAHLTTNNIERIEIIRGPQSTLYGSSAMSGVINIITKKGEGKPKFSISSDAGSQNTFRELLGLSGSTEKINYSFSLSRVDSAGISSAAGGAEKDGCGITNASSCLGVKVFDDSELNLVLRYTDADIDLDDGADQDDPNSIAEKRMLSSKIQLDQPLTDWWKHKVFFSFLDTKRNYKDSADSIDTTEDSDSWYKGNIKKIDLQHDFFPFDFDTITCGFDYKEERGSSYYRSGTWISKIDRKSVDNKGYYLQNQLKLWEEFFTTVGVRIDDHELFGTESTYKISSAYFIPQTGVRFSANWGTGFRAPSVYQLYSSYGDPSIKPEKSESYDFGFEQSLFENKVSFGATYFHNEFKQMIGWDWVTWKYANIDKAKTSGIEIEASVNPMEKLTISANHTFLEAEDETTGLELTRRPKNKSNLDINYGLFDKGNINLGVTRVGHRWVDSDNTQKMKPYTKVDLAAAYDLTENFQIFGRIGNLFDKKAQEVYGYSTPEASFSAGVNASF